MAAVLNDEREREREREKEGQTITDGSKKVTEHHIIIT